MHLDFARQLELGYAQQILAQHVALDFKLMLVAGMLIVAASAALKVGTTWFDAARRWLNDGLSLGAGEAGLLFGYHGFDFFRS